MPVTEYDAFISYRRSDGSQVAHWLRRELQGFRVPKPLRERYGRPLRLYLDTAYERGTNDFYENSIRPALLSSRWLLVIATPDARLRPQGAEDWILREVTDFASGPNGRNVIAVRGGGEFNDPLPADLVERFPRIEIVDLRGASRFSFLNPVRAARLSAEKLKLLAPLLDIPPAEMPRFRQEEERRQQTRLGATVGVTTGVIAAVSALSVFALQSRYQATRALEDSMFATGRMVLQSADIGPGSAAAIDRTRRLLINQGCDLIDKLSSSSGREPQIAELVTCRLERARARAHAGEHDLARGQYAEAIALASARHNKTKRTEAGESLLTARKAYADYLREQKQPGAAQAEYRALMEDARALQAQHPKQVVFITPEAEAAEVLGDLLDQGGDHAQARDSYEAGAQALSRALRWVSEDRNAATLRSLSHLQGLVGMQKQRLDDKEGALASFRQAVKAAQEIPANQMRTEWTQEVAVIQAMVFDAERQRGNAELAEQARRAAIEACDRVIAASTTSAAERSRAEQLRELLNQGAVSQSLNQK